MRSTLVISAVDSHTEGMPTRVVTGGVGTIPGASMAERRAYFMEHMDNLRTLLMFEPRGHSAMSGAILQPSTRPDADWGVLYIEVSGCLPMCGHGTIGVATVLVETGMVEVHEPLTTVRLDTPAGLVVVEVAVRDGKAEHVTLTNVPSFSYALDHSVDVPALGAITYDLAYGGNFYAILPLEQVGLPFDRAAAPTDPRRRASPSWTQSMNRTARCIQKIPPSLSVITCSSPPLAATVHTHATRWPSTPAGSTGHPVELGHRRGWPSCTRGVSSDSRRTS